MRRPFLSATPRTSRIPANERIRIHPAIETLESRRLFTAINADAWLTGEITQAILPEPAVIGSTFHGRIVMKVSNNSGLVEKDPAEMRVLAFQTGGDPASATPVASKSRRLGLRNNQSKSVVLSMKSLPSGLLAGNYTLLVQVINAGTGSQGPTDRTLTVAEPVVSLAASVGAISPATIRPAGSGSFALTISNSGNVDSTGLMNVTLGASEDGSTPGATLANFTSRVTVKTGGHTQLHLRVRIPRAAKVGGFFPSVSISQNGHAATTIGSSKFTIGN
jgi:hypothetical protein